jgi:hypothetical protein
MSEHDVTSEAAADVALLEVQERFAIVPEWLLDADVSDAAIRLYAVLLRYGQSSGARMPGRATLARRLRKKSVDTIDRAMRELVDVVAVTVEHRYAGGQRLTNRYHLHTSQPTGSGDQPVETSEPRRGRAGSRTSAATPAETDHDEHGDGAGGGRKNAATLAAEMRHDPKHHHLHPQPPEPANRRTGGGRRRTDSSPAFISRTPTRSSPRCAGCAATPAESRPVGPGRPWSPPCKRRSRPAAGQPNTPPRR